MEPEDVNQPDPSAGTEQPEPVLTAPETVIPEPQATDRPVQNVVGEMNRKFGKMQDQMNLLMQMVAQGQQPAAAAATKPPTDEELWSLAQQGDRVAFESYMARIADRRTGSRLNELQHTQAVTGQIGVLVQRYPAFNDPSHPLNQAYQANYNLLVQNGYPATRATQLDAMKTAIADRPDLVVAMHQGGQRAGEASRVSASQRARAGQTGVASQDGGSQRRTPAPAINRDQADLAKRMGIKDPAKAIERFRQRQETGESKLGAVATFIPEDSL